CFLNCTEDIPPRAINKKWTSHVPFSIECLSDLFLDLRGLADSVAQEVQLCTAYTALTNDLNTLDVRGMQREHSLHADAIGNAANRKRFGDAGTLAGDHSALKHLNSLAVTFADVNINADGVANLELGNFRLYGILSNQFQCVHVYPP